MDASFHIAMTAGPLLVVYATQTGVAEDLAAATREVLLGAGGDARVLAFDELPLAMLEGARCVLFVASTTCDGDPPDMAEVFFHEAMAQPAALGHLHYGLLALGDRGYNQFCGFGRRLDAWLEASGAQACFPRIDVDDEDAEAVERWYRQVAGLVPSALPRQPSPAMI